MRKSKSTRMSAAHGTNRRLIEEDEVCGHLIPGDSFAAISAYVTRRHPEFWRNREGFDPDRFLPGPAQVRPRYPYFPFGAGPRQCIGNGFALLEARLIMAMVGQRFEWELVPGWPVQARALATL